MAKKKIIIVSHAMEIGGAERALLGLLEAIDTTQYQVDLFLERHQGELMKYIPDDINLLPEIKEYSCMAVPIIEVIKKGQLKVVYGRLKAKLKAKRFIKANKIQSENAVELEYSHKYTVKYMPQISGEEYDLAISFLTPHYYVAENVKAKKRIAWIHTDYSFLSVDSYSELSMWQRYDYIASISEDCTKGFLNAFPSLSEKIVEIENITSIDFIKKQSSVLNVSDTYSSDYINILSIGRFCYQKNFDNVPDICKRIRNAGINVKWYLIGFGSAEDLIKEKISEANMDDYVIVLGKKSNPYPYIANCDFYIQPSRYEGKAVTIREAQILNRPIVITNYPTSSSQLNDGFDGVIVPMENKACADAIISVIQDKELQERLINNTKQTNYSNTDEIHKLYKLI